MPYSCTPSCNQLNDINYGHLPEQRPDQAVQLKDSPTKCEQHRAHTRQLHHAHYQLSSESEEECDHRERVPNLRPGQYDGTTPWREFMIRFESCTVANYWSRKTMAVQLKFCLVGAAGAIVHKTPRSSQWVDSRLWRRWRWHTARLRSIQLQWPLN